MNDNTRTPLKSTQKQTTDPSAHNYQGPPQKSAPHRCPDNTNHCLNDEQLNDNLRVYVENHLAWPKRPIGGFQGMYDDTYSNAEVFQRCGYGKAGIQSALTRRWHEQNGPTGVITDTVEKRIKAMGIDMSKDNNPGWWA